MNVKEDRFIDDLRLEAKSIFIKKEIAFGQIALSWDDLSERIKSYVARKF